MSAGYAASASEHGGLARAKAVPGKNVKRIDVLLDVAMFTASEVLSPPAGLSVEVSHELEAVRPQWKGLERSSGNIFSTWDWAVCWRQAFARTCPLVLITCRNGHGEAVAVFPLYLLTRTPFRALRFLGNGPADQLGPVCDRRRVDRLTAMLPALLSDRSLGWDFLIADRLPGRFGVGTPLPGAKLLQREASPVMRIAGRSWRDFLASRSRNFREQVLRRRRKLEREHQVRFRLSDEGRFERDFDLFVRLHDARWQGLSRSFAGRLGGFHREFARRALERGWLRLWVMEVDGAAVAAWYGFRFGGVQSYYNSGRDPAWDHHSVGFVLLTHTMQEAFNDGMQEYRMLRGGEDYKGRFATEDEGVQTVATARGLGRVAWPVGERARRTLPYRARKRFARPGGLLELSL
jgi:CelD/BcsL family acetyltransferase involved in cellulose biosynthesis